MKKAFTILAAAAMLIACGPKNSLKTGVSGDDKGLKVTVAQGVLEGVNHSGVKLFLGVPFAQAPVGDLRWKEPQPAPKWDGVRKADKFGPNPMQAAIYGDMNFGTGEMSEDCLYLNIWTPSKSFDEGLPVLIYFNGGGLSAGSGSEPRYAGESMARNGVISITANYREGIFGFFSHHELTAESDHKASGNYGLMDQAAAINWVYENIAAFGGDPKRITIAGESAGSMSVSAQMASPLAKGHFSQAIGSSASMFPRSGKGYQQTLAEAEEKGALYASETLGCSTLAELRAISGEKLLELTGRSYSPINAACVDGYFFPEQPYDVFANGKQADVPLLLGCNSTEQPIAMYLRGNYTLDSVRAYLQATYGDAAEQLLNLYGFKSDADIFGEPGANLGSDAFVAFSTWLWGYMHRTNSRKPVYYYRYCHPRPGMRRAGLVANLAGGTSRVSSTPRANAQPQEAPRPTFMKGAVHSADIEYAMGNLPTNEVFAWTADDYAISEIFQGYYLNFIKTGNPNGLGLTQWDPAIGSDITPTMQIDLNCAMQADKQLHAKNLALKDFYFPSN